MPVRELVPTMIRTEFGDVLDSPEFYDVGGADRDLTYVPGFSDMRRTRDLAFADIASGKRQRHEVEVAPLPVNCRWTRTTTVKGEPDGRKQIASGNLGYTAVNKTQIGKVPWLTALPPGATIDPDGAIRKGDTILMVTDAKNAGRNVARRTAQTQRLGDATASAKGGLMDVGGKTKGVDPYVKKEG